jgi:hypothetical protein
MKIDPSLNIPTASSKAEEWIAWHKDLKKVFGKKKANSIWIFAWAKRGGINSPANTNMLSAYIEPQGIDVTRTSGEQIAESITEIVGGIFTFGKILFIGGLATAGIILILILRALLKNPQKSVQTAVLLTPQGRTYAGVNALAKSNPTPPTQ